MTREQLDVAFESLFDPLLNSGALKTVSRRFRFWDQVTSADKPCMFITKFNEQNNAGNISTPTIITANYGLWIYTDAGQDQNSIPMTTLNNLLDSVSSAFVGSPIFGNVTLGGIAIDVRISGEIKITDGSIDGNGVAFVPVKILIPSF